MPGPAVHAALRGNQLIDLTDAVSEYMTDNATSLADGDVFELSRESQLNEENLSDFAHDEEEKIKYKEALNKSSLSPRTG